MAVVRPSHLVLLAALAVRASGGDQPAAPAGGTSDDSIAAAKRDFDGLKSSRSTADSPRLDLPAVNTPTLHLSDDEMAAFMQSQSAQKKKEMASKPGKPGNWLVDAMADKKATTKRDPKSIGLPSEETDATDTLAVDLSDTARAHGTTASDAAKPAVSQDNPLTSYMAGWMTAKDFDLLKVKTAETNFDAGPGRGGPDRAVDPVGLGGLAHSDGLSGLGRSLPAGAATEARPNPYLADLGPVPVTGTKDLMNLPGPSSPGYVPPTTLLPPAKNDIVPAKSDAPANDLLKPSTDAKYFPQLKRF